MHGVSLVLLGGDARSKMNNHNFVLNKTEEGGIRYVQYKVQYNDKIYYYKECINRYGEFVEGYVLNDSGQFVSEPDLFECIIEIVNEFEKPNKYST